MYKIITDIIKKVFVLIDNFDLSNPKEIPCNQNCIVWLKKNVKGQIRGDKNQTFTNGVLYGIIC